MSKIVITLGVVLLALHGNAHAQSAAWLCKPSTWQSCAAKIGLGAARRGMLLDHKPAMPGFTVHSVSGNVDGKWIKRTQEPGEERRRAAAPSR